MGKKMNLWLLIPFLLLQLVAYYMILWEGGDLRRWSSYGAILLCFAFAAPVYGCSRQPRLRMSSAGSTGRVRTPVSSRNDDAVRTVRSMRG